MYFHGPSGTLSHCWPASNNTNGGHQFCYALYNKEVHGVEVGPEPRPCPCRSATLTPGKAVATDGAEPEMKTAGQQMGQKVHQREKRSSIPGESSMGAC